jgi:hypothetical protein
MNLKEFFKPDIKKAIITIIILVIFSIIFFLSPIIKIESCNLAGGCYVNYFPPFYTVLNLVPRIWALFHPDATLIGVGIISEIIIIIISYLISCLLLKIIKKKTLKILPID